MTTTLKSADVRLKAGPDDGLAEGQFTAYASVFGNVDSYGDVVAPGAFAKSLNEWAESGNALPLLYGHQFGDPDYNIGHVVSAAEDDHGLLVTAQIDLESPKGAQVYRLIKGRRVSQMSFAYDVLDSAPIEVDGVKATELRQVKLYEVSVVPIGANQATEILAVKQRQADIEDATEAVKAGRVLAKKHLDGLKQAVEYISAVIESAEASSSEAPADDEATETGKASVPAPTKDEAANGGKSEESAQATSVTARLAAEIQILSL